MANTSRRSNGLIKAHITREQRELLLQLVTRRLHDVRNHVWGNWRPAPTDKEMLEALQTELEQAGS
jgi:hypothetical protein